MPYAILFKELLDLCLKGIHPAYFQYAGCYYLKVFVNYMVIIAS